MSVTTAFSANQVKNVITKFYYKDNHLCFQILLDLNREEFVSYSEYIDYGEYKKAYDHLINLKSINSPIEFPLIELEKTNINLA